jgi:DNA polymerase-3 subunit gamma/tau
MRFIVKEEGIEASDEVLSVVAHAGEGSVRDSLSALDQAIACCGTTLNVDEVRALLGVFGVGSLRSVAEAVIQQDGSLMLDIVQELEATGQSLQHFSRELSRYWRNLLVAKLSGKPTRLIAASDQEQESMLETAGQFSEEDLTRYLNLTLDLYKALQYSLQPRLHLELGLIKLVHAGRLQSIESALAGLGKAPAPAPVLSASARATVPRPPAFQAPAPSAPKVTVEAPPPPPVEVALAPTGDLRTDLHAALTKEGLNFSADAILQADVSLHGSDLLVRGAKSLSFGLQDPGVARVASKLLGKPVRVKFEVGESSNKAAAPAPVRAAGEDTELRDRALSHPGVKRFQELFQDAQVRTVRNLNE